MKTLTYLYRVGSILYFNDDDSILLRLGDINELVPHIDSAPPGTVSTDWAQARHGVPVIRKDLE